MSDSLRPMDYTLHGTLQARILEWVAFPFSRGSSQPRDGTQVSRIAGGFFTSWATLNNFLISFTQYGSLACILGFSPKIFLSTESQTNTQIKVCIGDIGHAAAAKLLQSCPTLCDPRDGSPPGSPVPGILQARTLEWVAISFSSAWKWKVKVKSLSRVRLLATPWTATYQAPPSVGFSRQEYWSGVPLPSLDIGHKSKEISTSKFYTSLLDFDLCSFCCFTLSRFNFYVFKIKN